MKHSESIVNISKALLNVQKEIKNTARTAENPFFKSSYTPLPETLDMVKPLCNKHGLLLLQEYGEKGVSTMIIHPETGEWIAQEAMPMGLDKDTPQGAGSAYTYGRRYQIAGFFGFASEEDDDGNAGEKGEKAVNKHFSKPDEEQHIEGEQFTIGQEVPKAYWNLSLDQKKKYMPKGCKVTKIDNIWKVVPIGE
jgi:hypothetical protein